MKFKTQYDSHAPVYQEPGDLLSLCIVPVMTIMAF